MDSEDDASGRVSLPGGEGVENPEDEMNILADQDETGQGLPEAEDDRMGGMGTDEEFGAPSGEFARGEVGVDEQMKRTTDAMDRASGGSRRGDEGPDA